MLLMLFSSQNIENHTIIDFNNHRQQKRIVSNLLKSCINRSNNCDNLKKIAAKWTDLRRYDLR